jgi:hypothetical protein
VGDCPDVPGWKGGRPRLAPQHLEKLTGSAVHGDVADERGYWSADTKTEMDAAGFGPSQRRPPALVIPLWGVTGELVGAQARPDEPRAIKGRTVKYETQAGQRMTLDVPPRARPMLADPTVWAAIWPIVRAEAEPRVVAQGSGMPGAPVSTTVADSVAAPKWYSVASRNGRGWSCESNVVGR